MAIMNIYKDSYNKIVFPKFEDIEGEIWSAPVEIMDFEILTSRNQESRYKRTFVTFKKDHSSGNWVAINEIQLI